MISVTVVNRQILTWVVSLLAIDRDILFFEHSFYSWGRGWGWVGVGVLLLVTVTVNAFFFILIATKHEVTNSSFTVSWFFRRSRNDRSEPNSSGSRFRPGEKI